MWRDWCMKPGYYLVEHLLLQTHLFKVISSFEAILFVNKRPNIRSVVSWVRLNVCIYIKIFSFVIFFILHMPYPLSRSFLSFFWPYIFIFVCTLNFISFNPILRYIFLVASANRTTLRLTEFVHIWQRTFRVKVNSEQSEIFSFD